MATNMFKALSNPEYALRDTGYGQYSRLADRLYSGAYTDAWNQLGGATGGELIGLPGMLASESVGPGELGRMRERLLTARTGDLARSMAGLRGELAKEKLSFARTALEEKRKKKKSGNVFSKIAGTAAGAGLGFLTGGPTGAIAGGISGLTGMDVSPEQVSKAGSYLRPRRNPVNQVTAPWLYSGGDLYRSPRFP